MSINIHISATIEATLSNGDKTKVIEYFQCWQTPSDATKRIISKENDQQKIEEYKEWANDINEKCINKFIETDTETLKKEHQRYKTDIEEFSSDMFDIGDEIPEPFSFSDWKTDYVKKKKNISKII